MATLKTKVITGSSYWLEACIDPFNRRVRIDDLRGNIFHGITVAENLAKENQAEKLIIKARQEQYLSLVEQGFTCEAVLDRYFLGANAYFFTKYYQEARRQTEHWVDEDETIKQVFRLSRKLPGEAGINHLQLRKATLGDAVRLAQLYREVFPIYPTPLHDPDYVGKTIRHGTIYYLFETDNQIVSAASCEPNEVYKNAELTDCATKKSHRKQGLVKILLRKLEEELLNKGIYCAYSLARAQSFGMNAAFFQLGYQYRGRLVNNCFIYDKLENMNLWVKDLSQPLDERSCSP